MDATYGGGGGDGGGYNEWQQGGDAVVDGQKSDPAGQNDSGMNNFNYQQQEPPQQGLEQHEVLEQQVPQHEQVPQQEQVPQHEEQVPQHEDPSSQQEGQVPHQEQDPEHEQQNSQGGSTSERPKFKGTCPSVLKGEPCWALSKGKPCHYEKHGPVVEQTHVYVCHLPLEMGEAELKDLFSPFGEIAECKVLMHPRTNESRGAGFVHYKNHGDAKKAIDAVDGMELPNHDQMIQVRFARPNRKERGGGFGRRPPWARGPPPPWARGPPPPWARGPPPPWARGPYGPPPPWARGPPGRRPPWERGPPRGYGGGGGWDDYGPRRRGRGRGGYGGRRRGGGRGRGGGDGGRGGGGGGDGGF